jgi:hypothetical protein
MIYVAGGVKGGIQVFTLKGKLYELGEKQCMSNVKYRLLGGASGRLWGELIPVGDKCLSKSGNYMVKLENNHKVKCNIRRHANAGITGVPAHFVYRFETISPLALN